MCLPLFPSISGALMMETAQRYFGTITMGYCLHLTSYPCYGVPSMIIITLTPIIMMRYWPQLFHNFYCHPSTQHHFTIPFIAISPRAYLLHFIICSQSICLVKLIYFDLGLISTL